MKVLDKSPATSGEDRADLHHRRSRARHAAVIKQFVANFHPRMVGLTGSPMRSPWSPRAMPSISRSSRRGSGGGYLVDHLAVAFLMIPNGEPITSLPIDKDGEAIAADSEALGPMSARFWEDVPLAKLDRAQWEALCDGCGKCCVHKLEDEDTGELHATNVACRLLDRRMGAVQRLQASPRYVSECVRLTAAMSPRSNGCPRPAPIACAPRASRCPTGIIWSAATARRCTPPASRRAAGRSPRTMPAISRIIWWTASACEGPADEAWPVEVVRHARRARMRLAVDPRSGGCG
jgi:hypothetical protein